MRERSCALGRRVASRRVAGASYVFFFIFIASWRTAASTFFLICHAEFVLVS